MEANIRKPLARSTRMITGYSVLYGPDVTDGSSYYEITARPHCIMGKGKMNSDHVRPVI